MKAENSPALTNLWLGLDKARRRKPARLCHAGNMGAKMDIAPGGLSRVCLPCIRARRTEDSQSSDGRRGVMGMAELPPEIIRCLSLRNRNQPFHSFDKHLKAS